MTRQCRQCQRLNPAEAAFCFYDGVSLANGSTGGPASIDFSTWAFPQPFVFPSGEKCHNFLQLALACHRNPSETIDVLRRGFLEGFFGSMGRVDLAMAASAAAKMTDPDRGLDDLLEKLPGSPLDPAELEVTPAVMDLGILQVGQDRHFDLTLKNKGHRLVYGKVSVADCHWIVLGTGGGTPEKVFQFFDKTVIPVTVVGNRLRAYAQPLHVELSVESNGGNFLVPIEAKLPIKPFPEGVLSGATSPRLLAEKAKAHPKEAAALLENGAVARWYEANGWAYPVQGPTASGIAAVQQFFEVLGLVKPPKVDLSESAVTLRGRPGERLEYSLTAVTQEKRAAVAHAVSDQAWLKVGRTVFRGQMASIPLVVESIPDGLGATVQANLKVTANGGQRFDVPVTLLIEGGQLAPEPLQPLTPAASMSLEAAIAGLPSTSAAAGVELVPFPEQPAVVPATAEPLSFAPAVLPAAAPGAPSALDKAARRKMLAARLLPVGIVLMGLLTAVARDALFREAQEEPLPEIDYDHPVVDLRFHDGALRGDFVPATTMTFGLGVPDPKDTKKFKTKLIYDEYGRTCNVCVRIDKKIEYLLGREQGAWKAPAKGSLGKDRDGHPLIGAQSTWVRSGPPKINITQYVEIVPGGLSADGKKRLLDTCQVRYDITNEDTKPHTVALRFLLDTFIGGNDAVPFTIAGAKELCDTMKSFGPPSKDPVPDYISALQKQDLKDPGTVAHLSLKYGGGLEPPSRVTLGAWPAGSLRREPGGEKAEMQDTRWEVPVLPMALAKSAENPNGDSAVTMYWDDKEVKPKEARTVGFAYGLGSLTGEKGEGQLGITAGGELVANKEFSLTAYVKNPAPGTTITLTLPRGLQLVGGNGKEVVPTVPPGSSSPYSPVTWRIKATRGGVHRVTVALSTGVQVQHRLVIKQAEIFK
jgi:hypothetical protein